MMYRHLFLVLGVAMSSAAAEVRVLERIVAKVNGEIITTGELERSRKQIEQELRGQASDPQVAAALKERQQNLLRDKIDQLLLTQKGKELNISVDAEVSKRLAAIQLENKIPDQDQFQQWIREASGMPFEDFKAEMRNGLLTQRVIQQEVGSRINIPKAEVAKYYEEHKAEFVREERVFLQEILVATKSKDPQAVAAAEKKANSLVARARKGERFGELARDNSDADSAKNMGDLGAFKKADLNPKIADLVFSHDRGYVTDPIRIDNGFLILRIEERHKAGQAQLDEVENEIMERLYTPRFNPAIRAYLTRLREEAFLEIREGFVDSGAAPGKDTSWKDPAQLKPETVTKEEVAMRVRRKRLLWMLPVPGTEVRVKSRSSN